MHWPADVRQTDRYYRQTAGRGRGNDPYLPSQQTPCAPGSSLAPALHSASPWLLNRQQSRSPCGKKKPPKTLSPVISISRQRKCIFIFDVAFLPFITVGSSCWYSSRFLIWWYVVKFHCILYFFVSDLGFGFFSISFNYIIFYLDIICFFSYVAIGSEYTQYICILVFILFYQICPH